MARCPNCKEKVAYKELLFLTGYKTIKCYKCGAVLSTSKIKMIPFTSIVVVMGCLFGITYVSTGFSVKWLKIIIASLLLVFLSTPIFMKLKVDDMKDK